MEEPETMTLEFGVEQNCIKSQHVRLINKQAAAKFRLSSTRTIYLSEVIEI